MAEEADRKKDGDDDDDPKAWKWIIWKRIWDLMRNFAQNPRPVQHRIPNFVGATAADQKLGELEAFKTANCVKVNPDSPQKQVRFLTVSDGKKLLTPQPRLRTGFFSILDPLGGLRLNPSTILEACTSVGAAKYGGRLGWMRRLKLTLLSLALLLLIPLLELDSVRGRDLQNSNTECCSTWAPLMTLHRL